MAERQIRFHGKMPSKSDLIMSMCAEMMAADLRGSQKFYECFVPSPKQQEIYDLIDNSQVPDQKWLHILLYGDTGGAKTWTAIGYAIRCMLKGPGCKVLCVRETKGDLMLTTYGEVIRFFQKWDVKIVQENKTLGLIKIENGSEIHFRSDRALTKTNKDKSDSLGSSEFSVVIFEEVDSVSKETYRTISGRMRQKCPGIRKVVFGICNPPRPGHWIFKMYNWGDRQKVPMHMRRWILFHMLAKDNPYLSEQYDEAKIEDWQDDPAFLRRMGYGELGPETRGIPVFHRSFSRVRHVCTQDLRQGLSPHYPLWRGWDFGFNHPAMVVLQDDPNRGQIRVVYAIVEQEMSTWQFVKTATDKLRADFSRMGLRYEDFSWSDACDPAGAQRQSSSGLTDIEVMQSLGIYPVFRKTKVNDGIDIIEEQLMSNCYQDQPAITIDARCTDLIDALESGYCAKEDSVTGVIEINKDGLYDHIVDAFRYLIIAIRRPGQKYQPWAERPSNGWVSIMNGRQADAHYQQSNFSGKMRMTGPQHQNGGAKPAMYKRGLARRRY